MQNLISFDDFDLTLNESVQYETKWIMLKENYDTTITSVNDALKHKFVLNFYYKGERTGVVADGIRQVEPYALGVSKNGYIVLRAWLIRGISKTGKVNPKLVPGWRLFRIDRISDIVSTQQKFTTPRKGYNKEDRGMTEIMNFVHF